MYYFISKYRIRRLAELKLLGFIISLKYYCKFWQKAETFCIVMGVMRFLPLGEAGDAFTYCFDHSTQTFFFAVYRLLMSLQTVTEEGATYVPCSEVKRIMKAILFFSEEMNISRLSAKVDKGSKIFNTIEHCDFDHIMLLFIE